MELANEMWLTPSEVLEQHQDSNPQPSDAICLLSCLVGLLANVPVWLSNVRKK